MGKIPSKLLSKMNPYLCGGNGRDENHPWCEENPKPIDLSAYIKAEVDHSGSPEQTPDEVKFCRHFRSSGLADSVKQYSLPEPSGLECSSIANSSKTFQKIDEDCEAVLKKYDYLKTLHRGGLTKLSGMGFFLTAFKKSAPSKPWTAGLNEWRTSTTDGFNFFQSGLRAAGAFLRAWNPHQQQAETENIGVKTTAEQTEEKVESVESTAYQSSQANLSMFFNHVESVEGSLLSFIDATFKTEVGFLSTIDNFDTVSLNEILNHLTWSIIDKNLAHSRFPELLERVNSESTHRAIKEMNDHYSSWATEYILPALKGQLKQLRTAIRDGDEQEIEGYLSEIESVSSDLQLIDDRFGGFTTQFRLMVEYARDIATSASPEDIASLEALNRELKSTKTIEATSVIRNILTATVNIRTLLDARVGDGALNTFFDRVDRLGQSTQSTVEVKPKATASTPLPEPRPESVYDAEIFFAKAKGLSDQIISFLKTVMRNEMTFLAADEHLDIAPLMDIRKQLTSALGADDAADTQFLELVDVMVSESTYSTIDRLNAHYTNWVFDYMLPHVVDKSRQLRRVFESGDQTMIDSSLADFQSTYSNIEEIENSFQNLISRFDNVTKDALTNSGAIEPEALTRLRKFAETLISARGVIHDVNNILTNINSIVELHKMGMTPEELTVSFDGIEDFDLSTLKNNVNAASRIQFAAASQKNVSVNIAKDMPLVERMPSDIRQLVFRAVSELVLNGIKYSDPQKASRWVNVDVVENKGLIDIIIEDNGVGIADIDGVLKLGGRERPDLAEGTGTGLAALLAAAKERGLTLSVESTLGKGSKIMLGGIDPRKPVEPKTSGGGNGGGSKTAPITDEPAGKVHDGSATQPSVITSASFAGFLQSGELTITPRTALGDEGVSDPFSLSISIFGDGQQSAFPAIPFIGIGQTTPTAKPMR
jgi:signal transduction histidine kinase